MAAPRLQTAAKSHRTNAVTDTQILRRPDAWFVGRIQFAISAQQGCHFTPAAFSPWGKVSLVPWHRRLLAQYESRLRRRLARDTPSVGSSVRQSDDENMTSLSTQDWTCAYFTIEPIFWFRLWMMLVLTNARFIDVWKASKIISVFRMLSLKCRLVVARVPWGNVRLLLMQTDISTRTIGFREMHKTTPITVTGVGHYDVKRALLLSMCYVYSTWRVITDEHVMHYVDITTSWSLHCSAAYHFVRVATMETRCHGSRCQSLDRYSALGIRTPVSVVSSQ